MKIVSLVVKFLPAHAAAVQTQVERIPGASCAFDSGDGRMIVLIEDGPGYATADSIISVHQIPQLMSITLAYEYCDDPALTDRPADTAPATPHLQEQEA